MKARHAWMLAFAVTACGKAGFTGKTAKKSANKSQNCTMGLADAGCRDLTDKGPDELSLPANENPPRFAFLVNDPQCSFCHLRVNGDIVSIAPVKGVRADSIARISGNWYTASTWQDVLAAEAASPVKPQISYDAGGQLRTNYDGPEMPHGPDGKPAFPTWDSAAVRSAVKGRIAGRNQAGIQVLVSKAVDGNVVLIGTPENPIELQGDVHVAGDVVIKGWYRGIGTIYADGNIYVPGDLRAVNSAFPFPADPAAAAAEATAALQANKDALGLATQKSVFVGDLEMTEPSSVVDGNTRNAGTIYTHPGVPADRNAAALKPFGVYDWIGGKDAYVALYDHAHQCADLPPLPGEAPRRTAGLGGFNLIEAFLYARNTVAGVSRRNSYTINGGVIADHMHIIAGAALCQTDDLHPVTGAPVKNNFLNYDHRMKQGLAILHHIGAYFTGK